MTSDWDQLAESRNYTVLLHEKTNDRPPRVTIGLPTFNRPDTIRRALVSIARQSYRDFVLVISDNAGNDPATLAAVTEIAADLPEVYLLAQQQNLGLFGNMDFLMHAAETEFFMWLSDDDEITETYLEELVALLDEDPDTVTAMGTWRSMNTETEGWDRPQLEISSRSRLARVFKFVAGEADDAAFYGLHRSAPLKQCRFGGYVYPNRGVLTNFCYLFMFDLLLQGRFRYTNAAAWICHNYSEKQYNRALARGIADRAKTLARRINVYALYCAKTARKAPLLLPVIIPASILGLARDILSASFRITARSISGGKS